MSLARRNSRRITVGGQPYRWAVSPDSGYMWLVAERDDCKGQRVEAVFEYREQPLTPEVARRVIEQGLASGWQPTIGDLKPHRVDGEAVRPVA